MGGKRGMTSMGDLAAAALAPVTGRRGLAAGEMLARWQAIAGSDIAAICTPERISWPRGKSDGTARPGVLVLRAARAHAIDVQHLSATIVERVNAYFGYKAVASIRLRQKAPARPAPERPAPAPLGAEAEAALDQALSAISDDGLREALQRLGRGALTRRAYHYLGRMERG